MKILPVVKTDNSMLPLAERCKKSWDYFHPDIPMHLVRLEDWKQYINELYMAPKYGAYNMTFGLFYAIQKMMVEDYDLLIHIDADTVITGRCDEMFTEDYDIAVSENEAYKDYYNAGVWASRDLDFIKDFFYVHIVSPLWDNQLFMSLINCIKSRKRIKVLDCEGSGVWYNERSREYWNRLRIEDDKLYTPDRQIKILHWAGGPGQPLENRMSCSLFSDEVKRWLNKITGGTTFTDYDGKDFGDFIKRTYGL
jgi:hypothetical protein